MSEHDAGYSPAAGGTAAGDPSRSTAEFRAFASRTGESDAPWAFRAQGRKVMLFALFIVVFAIVLALIAWAVAG